MNQKEQLDSFVKSIFLVGISLFCFLRFTLPVFAGPSGSTYEIRDYGFGNGGTSSVSGSTYGILEIQGEQGGGNVSGSTYKAIPGLVVTQLAFVPQAPTFTNPGNNYDRLLFIINASNNPSDTTFALQISTDNFVSDLRFVKSDATVGSTLETTDYKTYTNWGGASGTWITGLVNNTTYYLRVKARQGQYTETAWGPIASVATSNPTLTFTLSASSIAFNTLTPGNSYTDSGQSTTLTTSTNSYNGYVVYGEDNQPLTSYSSTIANYASPNNAPTSWSGTGFGYTTNDTNLAGSGGVNRFSNGTLYAGFQTTGSGDPVASNLGPVTSTPISNEQYIISYRVTAANTTPSGTYSNVIIYTIIPGY